MLNKRIILIFLLMSFIFIAIFIFFYLKISFLTRQERIDKFYPPGVITGFLGFKGKPVVKHEYDYFQIYNNQVYFSFPIPLDGYRVPIVEADVNSFQTLAQYMHWEENLEQDQLRSRNIGIDKNHVYCGAQKIPNLKTSALIYLGDGYLTDNKYTYFCDWNFKVKSDSIEPNTLEKLDNALFGTKIARSGYYYPLYKLLSGNNSYKLILKNIVTNGRSTYVEGQYIKVSNPYQLEYLTQFKGDEKIWPEESYFTDKANVFFKNKMLDIKYNPKLQSIPFDFKIYLYDPITDTYFYQSHKINYKGLKLIKENTNHMSNPIFSYGNNLAFLNRKTLKLKILNKNPFVSSLYSLSPNVLSNGKNIYFFREYNTFSSTLVMDFSELCSTTSEIRVLDNMPIADWKNDGNILIKHPVYKYIQSKGKLWKFKNKIYYLPEIGSYGDYLFEVYPIEDFYKLRKNQLNYEQAKKLLTNKSIFKPVRGKKFTKIKTINRFCFKNYLPDTLFYR